MRIATLSLSLHALKSNCRSTIPSWLYNNAGQFPIFPVKYLVQDRYESERKISQIDAPLLFLHGLRDRTVPIRYGRALFALAPEPKKFIEFADAGHNDLYDHGAAARVIAYLKNRGLNP